MFYDNLIYYINKSINKMYYVFYSQIISYKTNNLKVK